MVDLWSIWAIGVAGGLLPLFARWNERQRHTALALSTGIFLGAVFLHFLPTLASMTLADAEEQAPPLVDPAPSQTESEDPEDHEVHEDHEGHEGHEDHEGHEGHGDDPSHQGHDHASHGVASLGHAHGGDRWVWLFVLIGVLGVYLIEALVLRTHDHDEQHRHRAVGYAALLGLTIHALTAGVGYAAVSQHSDMASAILVAILAHKGFEAFSLTTVFQLAEFPTRKVMVLVLAFSCVTPLGMLAGDAIAHLLSVRGMAILTALAAGTFLYVCLCELLVEVFHHREDTLKRVALLALGIALTVVFEGIEHG